MRRILLFVLVFAATFILSACFEIEERLQLNSDGSGVKTITIDLDEMMDNPFTKMAIEEAAKETGNSMSTERVDSAINIYNELAPVNPQWTEEEAELVQRLEGHLLMDFEQGEGEIMTRFTFNDLDEVERIGDILRDASEPEKKDGPGSLGSFGNTGTLVSSYTFKRGKFAQQSRAGEAFDEIMNGEEMEAEAVDMMRGMLEGTVIRQVIEFPGKIRKVKGFAGHTVEENELSVEIELLELMNNPNVATIATSGEVKYKR